MINYSQEENYFIDDKSYQESIAEMLSLELQRDSRRFSADFEN